MLSVTKSDIPGKPVLIGVNDEFTPCTLVEVEKFLKNIALILGDIATEKSEKNIEYSQIDIEYFKIEETLRRR